MFIVVNYDDIENKLYIDRKYTVNTMKNKVINTNTGFHCATSCKAIDRNNLHISKQ